MISLQSLEKNYTMTLLRDGPKNSPAYIPCSNAVLFLLVYCKLCFVVEIE